MLLGQLTLGCPHALVPSQFPYRCSANMEELYDLCKNLDDSTKRLRNYSRSCQVNVNWLSRFWTRTTTRPYLFKLNQTLQYQRMQRYFYPFTDIFCCKKSSTPNISHHLKSLKYQLIFWRLPLPKKKRGKKISERKTLSTTTRLGREWPPCEQMTWTAVGAS